MPLQELDHETTPGKRRGICLAARLLGHWFNDHSQVSRSLAPVQKTGYKKETRRSHGSASSHAVRVAFRRVVASCWLPTDSSDEAPARRPRPPALNSAPCDGQSAENVYLRRMHARHSR